MSQSRNETNQDNSSQNNAVRNYWQNFGSRYGKSVKEGAEIGLLSHTLLFPVDKVIVKLQSEGGRALKEVVKSALGNGNFFKGFGMNQLAGVTKNVFLFPFRTFTNYWIPNECTANFVAGLASVYVTSPLNVWKTVALANKSTNCLKTFPDYFKGVHATALRDAVYWTVYFGVEKPINKMLESLGIKNETFKGAVQGAFAAAANNPLAVIGTIQKVSENSISIPEAARQAWKRGIRKGLYAGFGINGFFRSGLMHGAAVGYVTAKGVANKLQQEEEENYHQPKRSCRE